MMARLDDAVRQLASYSDADQHWLLVMAHYCMEAHRRAPGGVTIEIGTRMGGGAATLSIAILEVYGAVEKCPPLLTCDPYGCKPYNDGRGIHATEYGREKYLAMKYLLAGIPNHAHFRLPSRDFLPLLEWGEWWEDGRATPFRNVTFAFLDGEHDADTISYEARMIMAGLLPGGVILVDNIDHDARTVPGLRELGDVMIDGPYAVLRRSGECA